MKTIKTIIKALLAIVATFILIGEPVEGSFFDDGIVFFTSKIIAGLFLLIISLSYVSHLNTK